MTFSAPHAFPRRLLVAVAGLSPQILTETLYALAHQPEPFWPTRIHLVTTAEGARLARLMLLNPEPGHLWHLCRELGRDAPEFGDAQIHVLRNDDGEPLADIRSAADNRAVANQITRLMRSLCEDEKTAVHVSMAGGRKTLGYYAAYGLSLFGRSQDRLSHVLVDAPFESHREFFFPTRESRIIYDRSDRPLDTREARVELADIPFIRLSDGLPTGLMQGQQSFADLVSAAQEALRPASLTLDRHAGQVQVGGFTVTLADADLAFLLWFIRRAEADEPGFLKPAEGLPDRTAAADFLACFEEIQRLHAGNDSRPHESLRHGMDGEWFSNRVKVLKRKLSSGLGHALAEQVRVVMVESRPARYGLTLPLERISVR